MKVSALIWPQVVSEGKSAKRHPTVFHPHKIANLVFFLLGRMQKGRVVNSAGSNFTSLFQSRVELVSGLLLLLASISLFKAETPRAIDRALTHFFLLLTNCVLIPWSGVVSQWMGSIHSRSPISLLFCPASFLCQSRDVGLRVSR